MKKRGKKAEGFMGMGFGMIFSIFLIVIFIIVAVYAIKQFLDFKDCSTTGLFLSDLQSEVTNVFSKQASSFDFSKSLPSGIQYVCFANFSKELKGEYIDIGQDLSIYEGTGNNLFFYPRGKACVKTKRILNINLAEITKIDNPYCIQNVRGKVTIRVSKGFNQGLVTLI